MRAPCKLPTLPAAALGLRRSGRLAVAAGGAVDPAPAAPAAPPRVAAKPAPRRSPAAPASRRSAPAVAGSATAAAAPAVVDARRAHEAAHWARGCTRVAGVDEAGRGPLAGPVVAAACILPRNTSGLPFIGDSKKMSERQREEAYAALTTHPGVEWYACVVGHDVVDRDNIFQATLAAMVGAVAGLRSPPDAVLVDGPHTPPSLGAVAQPLVGGDGLSLAIGAASVIAKVTRDRILVAAEADHPGYGFARHKGYGTAAHMAAIARLGPCPIHRRSFAPVKHMKGV